MSTKLSAALLLILSTLFTFIQPANAQAQLTTYPSPSGYRITISKPVWHDGGQDITALSFDFTISHADGSPVLFDSQQNAILVAGWTETNFDPTTSHTGYAVPISTSGGTPAWHVELPGLDPRDKLAHIQFDVRQPNVPSWLANQLVSDVQFDHIPLPSQPDVSEPLNDTFTSDWGTVFTLSGLTRETLDKQTNQPAVRLDLMFDHTKVPDDQIHPYLQAAYDNGLALNGFNAYAWTTPDSTGVVHLISNSTLPQTSPDFSLDFRIEEDSDGITDKLVWTPLAVTIPLAGIAPAPVAYRVTSQRVTNIDGVQYSFKQIASTSGQDSGYLLSTQSQSPTEFYRFTNISWAPDSNSNQYNIPSAYMFNNVYWNVDGTPDKPGEYQTYVPNYEFSNWRSKFPLLATVTEVTHDQQILSFTKIPVPANGETLVVRQKPVPPSSVPLVLKSIAWNPPVADTNGGSQSQTQNADSLILTFEYVTEDKSSLSLAVINARDDANDEIEKFALSNIPAAPNLSSVDPNQRVFTVATGLPPHGSQFINLKVILTRDHPVGTPVQYSIDSSGVFTVVPPVAPSVAPTH